MTTISFGDNVRVISTALTTELGLAGLVGSVHGETVPSATKVKVIGDLANDYAVNVYFENRKEGFWFAPELLEFVDHAAGTEITIKGVAKKWVRSASGEWQEVPTSEDSRSGNK